MHKLYNTWNGLDVYPINDDEILLVCCIFNSDRRLQMQDIIHIAVVLIKYENLNLPAKSK